MSATLIPYYEIYSFTFSSTIIYLYLTFPQSPTTVLTSHKHFKSFDPRMVNRRLGSQVGFGSLQFSLESSNQSNNQNK